MKFKKILDLVLGTSLFLNLSETYRPIGVILGLPSSNLVSSVTLILNIIYIVFNFTYILFIFKKKLIIVWTNIIIVLPIISLFINFIFDNLAFNRLVYWISFTFLFGSLFIAATIFFLRNGGNIVKYLYWGSFISTTIGFVINFTNYSFMRKILEFSNNRIAIQETLFRPLSFFPHPNHAAFAIICFLIFVLISFRKPHKTIFFISIISVSFLLIIITGSRTSILLLLVIILFSLKTIYVSNAIRRNINIKLSTILIKTRFILFLTVIIIGVPLLYEFLLPILDNANILVRINSLTALINGNNINDQSILLRTQIISIYLTDIIQSPLFGYGPDVILDNVAKNTYSNVSQNAYIESAAKYGIPYTLYYIYGIITTIMYSIKKEIPIYSYKPLYIIVVFITLIGFSVVDLFQVRTIVITVGFLIGNEIIKATTIPSKNLFTFNK